MPNLQLFGGHFQNGVGAPISGGTLLFTLSHDEQYTVGSSQIVAGQKFTTTLDSNGNIPLTPAFKIWDNASLLPSGSFYIVRLFDNSGAEVWNAPQYWQLNASPNPLDVGTIVPANPPGSGLAGTGGATLLLQTNETNNGDQSLLDLHAGTGITLADNGTGRVTITSSVAGIALKTNGVANGSQAILDLVNGSNVSITDGGSGSVTIAANLSGANLAAIAVPGTTSGFGDNKNCVVVVPAAMLLSIGSAFKLEFQVSTGGSVTIINAVVRRTLPHTNAWLDSTPITWGSNPTPTFTASSTNLSDAITLAIDTAHDYYFIVYAAFNAAASLPTFNSPWGTGAGAMFAGTDSATNFTTVATPSLISGLGNSGNGISRIITA